MSAYKWRIFITKYASLRRLVGDLIFPATIFFPSHRKCIWHRWKLMSVEMQPVSEKPLRNASDERLLIIFVGFLKLFLKMLKFLKLFFSFFLLKWFFINSLFDQSLSNTILYLTHISLRYSFFTSLTSYFHFFFVLLDQRVFFVIKNIVTWDEDLHLCSFTALHTLESEDEIVFKIDDYDEWNEMNGYLISYQWWW